MKGGGKEKNDKSNKNKLNEDEINKQFPLFRGHFILSFNP